MRSIGMSLNDTNLTLPFIWSAYNYHPMIFFRRCSNICPFKGFVKRSALCSVVSLCSIDIDLFLTYSRKWWYTWLICLVRGLILGVLVSSNAPVLSSNALHLKIEGMHFFKFLYGVTLEVDSWLGLPLSMIVIVHNIHFLLWKEWYWIAA